MKLWHVKEESQRLNWNDFVEAVVIARSGASAIQLVQDSNRTYVFAIDSSLTAEEIPLEGPRRILMQHIAGE